MNFSRLKLGIYVLDTYRDLFCKNKKLKKKKKMRWKKRRNSASFISSLLYRDITHSNSSLGTIAISIVVFSRADVFAADEQRIRVQCSRIVQYRDESGPHDNENGCNRGTKENQSVIDRNCSFYVYK